MQPELTSGSTGSLRHQARPRRRLGPGYTCIYMHIYILRSIYTSISKDQPKQQQRHRPDERDRIPLPAIHTHCAARTLVFTSLFWFSFLGLFYFRLAACFHASCPAWLSPAYLRRAHNRCLSCINGPFPNTAGARHPHSRATQVSLTLPLTRSPAAASHTTGSSPRTPIQSGGLYGGAVTRGSISRTHCHAPPESGLFLGRKAPYPSFIPNPSAAFPTGLDRRSPVSRPVLGGRDKRRERALWFLLLSIDCLAVGTCSPTPRPPHTSWFA